MLHYILVQPWGVYVKDGVFFESQGGLTNEWGAPWRPVSAFDLQGARTIAEIQQKTFLVARRVPAANKEDFSAMGKDSLRSRLFSICAMHGQHFEHECNACASAFDDRMTAKEFLGRIAK